MKQRPHSDGAFWRCSARHHHKKSCAILWEPVPLESLQEYVRVDQNRFRVELFRRNKHDRWELFSFGGEQAELELLSVDLRCTLAELYEAVDFDVV